MEEAIKATTNTRIEKAVEKKLQFAFTEDAGSYQLKKIATESAIDTMNENKYVQKLGVEQIYNEHVLSSLNTAVTRFVQDEAEKTLENTHVLVPQEQADVEATITYTETSLTAIIETLLQELNNRMTDIRSTIHRATSGMHNEIRNLDMKITELNELWMNPWKIFRIVSTLSMNSSRNRQNKNTGTSTRWGRLLICNRIDKCRLNSSSSTGAS